MIESIATDDNSQTRSKSLSASFDLKFSDRVRVPADEVMREIGEEALIVNLNSESYFGLDDIDTHMWTLLTASKSIQAAFDALMNEYDVEEKQLWCDFLSVFSLIIKELTLQINRFFCRVGVTRATCSSILQQRSLCLDL